MKAQQIRLIARTLSAKVSDFRRITSMMAGIRGYAESVTAGKELEAIAVLGLAIKLSRKFDPDFVRMLKAQVRVLKIRVWGVTVNNTVKVEFYGFSIPYTYVKGVATLAGVAYPFLCYFRAPSCANAAKGIDPTFDKELFAQPELRNKLREAVSASLVTAWDAYRTEVLNRQPVAS